MLETVRTELQKTAEDRGIPDWLKILGVGGLAFGGYNAFKGYQMRKAMQALQKTRRNKMMMGVGLLGSILLGPKLFGGDDQLPKAHIYKE